MTTGAGPMFTPPRPPHGEIVLCQAGLLARGSVPCLSSREQALSDVSSLARRLQLRGQRRNHTGFPFSPLSLPRGTMTQPIGTAGVRLSIYWGCTSFRMQRQRTLGKRSNTLREQNKIAALLDQNPRQRPPVRSILGRMPQPCCTKNRRLRLQAASCRFPHLTKFRSAYVPLGRCRWRQRRIGKPVKIRRCPRNGDGRAARAKPLREPLGKASCPDRKVHSPARKPALHGLATAVGGGACAGLALCPRCPFDHR